MNGPGSPVYSRSLGRRLHRWIALAFTATIVALTAAAVVEERRLIHDIEAANGEALVSHLAAMPEFRTDRAAAVAHAERLDGALQGAGIRLDVVPATTPRSAEIIASRPLDLSDGRFVLRYRSNAPWLARLLRRALTFHLSLGAVALGILLAGAEWILRARLIEPLRRMAHQVRFMRMGGGWEPKLPPSDAELAVLGRALEELGPALHAQVEEWLEGERRAAAARALSELRARLREPQHRALVLLGDIQAQGLVAPAAKTKVRALVADVERIIREIGAEEATLFGTKRAEAGTAPR